MSPCFSLGLGVSRGRWAQIDGAGGHGTHHVSCERGGRQGTWMSPQGPLEGWGGAERSPSHSFDPQPIHSSHTVPGCNPLSACPPLRVPPAPCHGRSPLAGALNHTLSVWSSHAPLGDGAYILFHLTCPQFVTTARGQRTVSYMLPRVWKGTGAAPGPLCVPLPHSLDQPQPVLQTSALALLPPGATAGWAGAPPVCSGTNLHPPLWTPSLPACPAQPSPAPGTW